MFSLTILALNPIHRGATARRMGLDPQARNPSSERLLELIKATGISIRSLLREKDTPYGELRFPYAKWTDENRNIVTFNKEDGEVVPARG
jgi:hypothetical protein